MTRRFLRISTRTSALMILSLLPSTRTPIEPTSPTLNCPRPKSTGFLIINFTALTSVMSELLLKPVLSSWLVRSVKLYSEVLNAMWTWLKIEFRAQNFRIFAEPRRGLRGNLAFTSGVPNTIIEACWRNPKSGNVLPLRQRIRSATELSTTVFHLCHRVWIPYW